MEHLTYDFNTHSLNFGISQNKNEKYQLLTFTIGSISTTQLEFDYETGEFLYMWGYTPLFKSIRTSISLPNFIEGKFIAEISAIPYSRGNAFNYLNYFPNSEGYMVDKNGLPLLYYDEASKVILIGTMDSNDKAIKVGSNFIFGFDDNKNLKYILILIDIIFQENNI